MAGPVRHPIDVAALERYLGEHVPEIEVPLDVKQVCIKHFSYIHELFLVIIYPALRPRGRGRGLQEKRPFPDIIYTQIHT